MNSLSLALLVLVAGCTDKPGGGADTAATDDADTDGYTLDEGDCDDGDAQVNPGEAELWYDGVDQDCDGNDDDQDLDGFVVADDCDDTDAAVFPGAEEVCDAVDNDCDLQVDAGATDAEIAWIDADGDGHGAAGTEASYCGELPEGYASVDDDCDDAQATVYPGAEEICDDLDNDCDGAINEGNPDEVPYYWDGDADGFGNAGDSVVSCASPEGYVADATDCDDTVATVYPGADEYCDEVDQDCDGDATNDPVDGTAYYTDADLDGYGDAATELLSCSSVDGWVTDGSDCDDADVAVNPGAEEVCDLEDNDCDGAIDDSATDERTYYDDADSDGYGDPDVAVSSCGLPSGYAETADDCDDANSSVNPGASERCNGLDDDCDAVADESDAVDATTYYADTDADTYGDPLETITSCDPVSGYVTDASDCDDASAADNPDGTEVCDAADNDCDGVTDEDDAADAATWYVDGDGDGYGSSGSTATACAEPAGFVASDTDCDDGSADVSPAGAESCNTIDDDCDGDVDESGAVGEGTWYLDSDGDGYGTDGTVDACDLPSGYAASGGDCDDDDATSAPGGTEADDLADNDCDGWVDEDFVVAGDVIVSEVTRQPRFGAASVNASGQWFELHNTSARDVDLSNWFVRRDASTGAGAEFYVDPDDAVVVPAGGYVVFCKTDDYTAASTAYSTLACDYVWSDEAEASTYAGTYRDNTFSLQRDEDALQVYVDGDASTGTLVDEVHWYYDASSGYWPRDATRSMSLDPAALDGTSNDSLASWCSTTNSSTWRWYYVSGTNAEYGSPGAANYDCP